jgi:hypothetical protein
MLPRVRKTTLQTGKKSKIVVEWVRVKANLELRGAK